MRSIKERFKRKPVHPYIREQNLWKRQVFGLVVFTVIIIVGISIYSHSITKKEFQDYLNVREHTGASKFFYLDAYYYSTKDPVIIELEPTGVTEAIIGRWREIAEIEESVVFPVESIENEDWVSIYNVWYDEAVSTILDLNEDWFHDATEEELPSTHSLVDYIYDGEIENFYMERVLDDKNIPDQYRRSVREEE